MIVELTFYSNPLIQNISIFYLMLPLLLVTLSIPTNFMALEQYPNSSSFSHTIHSANLPSMIHLISSCVYTRRSHPAAAEAVTLLFSCQPVSSCAAKCTPKNKKGCWHKGNVIDHVLYMLDGFTLLLQRIWSKRKKTLLPFTRSLVHLLGQTFRRCERISFLRMWTEEAHKKR